MSKKHKHKIKYYSELENNNSIWDENPCVLLGLLMLLWEALECIENRTPNEYSILKVGFEDKIEKSDKEENKIEIIEENISNEDISNEDVSNEDVSNEDISNKDISNEDVSNKDISNKDILNEDILEKDINDNKNIDTAEDIPPDGIKDVPEEKEKIYEKVTNNVSDNVSEKKINILSSKTTVYSTTSFQCKYNQGIEYYLSHKPAVADIPVVLSKFEIQVFIEAIINFWEPAFQIKSLDKKVVLKECELITGTDKLFIKGLLQENIEYATANCIKLDRISGDIKKMTINIPFKCSTKVNFSHKPQLSKVDKLEVEIIHFNKNNEDEIEKNSSYFELPSDKVFCDLDSTEILETNNREEMKTIENTLMNTYSFQKIRKKIILTLGLSLLQKQTTFICNSSFNNLEEIKKEQKQVDTYANNENSIEK